MIINPLIDGSDAVRVEGSLFGCLAKGRRDDVLVAVTCSAWQRPGAALMGPRRAMLQDNPGAVGDQYPGRAEASPVSMAEGTLHPAVAVAAHLRFLPHLPKV